MDTVVSADIMSGFKQKYQFYKLSLKRLVSHDHFLTLLLVHVAAAPQVEDKAEPGLLFPDDVLSVQRNLLRPGELKLEIGSSFSAVSA